MRSLRLFLPVVCGLQLAGWLPPVFAQTAHPPAVRSAPPVPLLPPLAPALIVEPAVIGPNAAITLTLPSNVTASGARWRVGLFEQGRPALLADIVRDFLPRGNALQATLNVQADPGSYEVRLIANDRARLPLTQPAPLLVTGIRREPGWWLLNGSPFAEEDATAAPANLNVPLFVPNLKRDFTHKSRLPSYSVPVPAAGLVVWRTVGLPPLRSLMALTPVELRARLEESLRTAQNRGQRGYLGWELPVGATADGAALPVTAANTMAQVRQLVNTLTPEAALILSVNANEFYPPAPDAAVSALGVCGAQADAVVLRLDPVLNGSWPVKAARRVAEEQPGYDLPILVQIQSVSEPARLNTLLPASAVLDYFMSGATGVVNGGPVVAGWQGLYQRNASLFVGSVTLEDTGLLPINDGLEQRRDATDRIYEALRAARRIPLMAHTLLQKQKVPESSVVVLGDRISDATVQALSATARSGGRLYIEGCPLLDEKGQQMWKLASLVGATAIGVPPKRTTMILEDPWTFGLGRGERIAVEQDVQVKLSPSSLIKTPKPEKGKDVLTGPRVAARLEDGAPAVIVTPVDKGEVVWMPYRIMADAAPASPASTTAVPLAPLSAPNAVANDVDRSRPLQRYYAAIAAGVQPSLAQVRGTDTTRAGAEAIRFALRRSAKGTLLLALYNTAPQPAAIAAAVDGVFGVALDLGEEKELPIVSRGFQTEAALTIPPDGWKLVAFAETRKALDAERNAPRAKAALR